MRKDLAIFLLVSFALSSLLDLLLYARASSMSYIEAQISGMLWGLARMYTPTLGALAALASAGQSLKLKLIGYFNLNKRSLKYFLGAPLIVYLASGIFFLIAYPLNLLDFDGFLELLVSSSGGLITKESAKTLFIINLALSYPAALTLNSVFALGEEIGWRGYLLEALGGKCDARVVILIGAVWGLWHSTAIALLGYNYPMLRACGIPLFLLFCTSLSIPMVKLVSESRSVLPAASLHGCVNAIWGYTVHLFKIKGLEGEIYGGLGAMGIVSLLSASLITLMLTGRISLRENRADLRTA